ncbi:MAG: aspartate aminotransferase family protein [Chloroflexi bacterium]|nr:aspartate aminotransferase family protein [Chloroflexota bacterium]
MVETVDVVEHAYRARTPTSAKLYAEAVELLPGGVTHSNRYWPPYPIYFDRVAGSRIFDVDGNAYVDYWLANGTMFMGHANPAVAAAVAEQLPRGSHFGLSNEPMLRLARKIVELVPCAERVRFTNSGTEAVAHALRVARGYTGRKKIARFQGTFHGVHDELYVGVSAPFDRPDCAGIPPSAYEDIILCPYNDLDRTAALLRSHRDGLAGVLVEPISSVIAATPEFLRGLREITTELGAVLIYDEIVTGFRMAPGGAQELFGVIPDLTALGKVLGGGFPIGALAGRREVMEVLVPTRPADRRVDIYGTYSGSPAVMAAGVATLTQLADGRPQRHAAALGERMAAGLSEILSIHGEQACVGRVGCLFQVYFGLDRPPTSHREAQRANGAQRRRFHLALMTRGIFFKYGSEGRISAAHTEADVDETLAQMEDVIHKGWHRA